MKPYPSGSNSGSAKTSSGTEQSPAMAPGFAASGWDKPVASSPAARRGVPQPPPVWTRYIDSRLKQFCTR